MTEPSPSPTTPPVDAVVPARHPQAPAPGEPVPSHYRMCFGCGQDQPGGLRMAMTAGEGLTITGEFVVTEHHQGSQGLAHGGIITAAFDEVLGSLGWLLASPAVTGRLEVDIRKPAPVGSVVRIEGRIVGVSGRKVYVEGTGSVDGGPPSLRATGLFVQVGEEHFRTHARPEGASP